MSLHILSVGKCTRSHIRVKIAWWLCVEPEWESGELGLLFSVSNCIRLCCQVVWGLFVPAVGLRYTEELLIRTSPWGCAAELRLPSVSGVPPPTTHFCCLRLCPWEFPGVREGERIASSLTLFLFPAWWLVSSHYQTPVYVLYTLVYIDRWWFNLGFFFFTLHNGFMGM